MSEKNKFTISYVFADRPGETNTSIYRCMIPAKALANAGYGVSLIPAQLFQEKTKESDDACNNSHVIVIERNLFGDVLTQAINWIVRGRCVIANFDDNYEVIESTNASYPYWHDGIIKVPGEDGELKTMNIFPHPLWQFKLGLKMCHAQIMPSKELVKYFGEYSPTYFVPNYFETQHYIDIPKEERDYIAIGWGGSLSHLQSFKDSGVLEALENVCRVRPNVKMMICGDKRVADIMKIPQDNMIFHPFVPHEQWGGIVARKFDIGLAPLEGEYDKYRSWIKVMEYMLTKTPWVASQGPAYNELNEYGKLIPNTVDDWTVAILDVIDNYQAAKEKANGKPYEFSLTQDIKNNVESITDTFREIAKKHANIVI